jgi:GWxTD domain-containing protein
MKNAFYKTNIFSLIFLIVFLTLADLKNVSAKALSGPDDPPSFMTAVFWGIAAFAFLSFIKKEVFDEDNKHSGLAESDSSSFAYKYIFPEKAYNEFIDLESELLRQSYIDSFWQNNFTGSSSSVNDLRNEFETRVKYANEKYGELSRKGWQADRGRVYIIYGTPALILHQPPLNNHYQRNLSQDWSDVEVWYYQRPKGNNDIPAIFRSLDDGRMFFVFIAPMSAYKYEQIFSTEVREKTTYFHY